MKFMNFHFPKSVWLLCFTILCFSCNNNSNKAINHGAIVLGDSATIVTERDPKKLLDLVTDLKPEIPPAIKTDTVVNTPVAVKDTIKKTAATVTPVSPAATPVPNVPGLKAEFKEVMIIIPNLNAKLAGKPNLSGANGAVYTWLNGPIDGAILRTRTKGTITKVSQRYQSVVGIKNKIGTLPLESLTVTTNWEAIKGGGNSFPIKGLDPESLEYPKTSNASIKNAVSRAAAQRRMNHKKVQEWVNSVGNARTPTQKPLTVMLRSVMWKIDGKDENGKIFSKQIRVDIPM